MTPEQLAAGRELGNRVSKDRAIVAYADIIPALLRWRDSGLTLQHVADRLNERGHVTRTGRAWTPALVRRVCLRWAEHKTGKGAQI